MFHVKATKYPMSTKYTLPVFNSTEVLQFSDRTRPLQCFFSRKAFSAKVEVLRKKWLEKFEPFVIRNFLEKIRQFLAS